MEYDGLKTKYIVTKADTGERVDCCFVLRPDRDPVALRALEWYAQHTDNHKLGNDIMLWLAGPEELNPPLTLEDLEQMSGEEIYTTSSGWIKCWGIDLNEGSPYGPRIDCGGGRGYSLMGFNETWRAYRRNPNIAVFEDEK